MRRRLLQPRITNKLFFAGTDRQNHFGRLIAQGFLPCKICKSQLYGVRLIQNGLPFSAASVTLVYGSPKDGSKLFLT